MNREPFTFYRALDAVQGSWDGYGYFPSADHDFLAFVSDAPTGASIQTPQLIKEYWTEYHRSNSVEQNDEALAKLHLADAVNRVQEILQSRSRSDGSTYQSTLIIVRKTGSRLLYCSVGDSILQVFRGGKLYRLTDTEVWDGSLIIEERQKTRNRQKTGPLKFVGLAGDFVHASDVGTFQLESGDLLILQTDGAEDLLHPDRLIQILGSGVDELKKQTMQIFDSGRIKDDVTMMVLPVEVTPEIDMPQEMQKMQSEVDRLKSAQNAIRSDVKAQGQVQSRLQNIEGTLQEINRKIQKLSEPSEARYMTRNAPVAQAGRIPWFPVILAFLIGILTGLVFHFLLTQRNTTVVPAPVRTAPTRTEPARTVPDRRSDAVAPPEITPSTDCLYVVSKGDSLQKIATARSVSVDDLLSWNPGLTAQSPLQIGQELQTCGGMP